MLLVKVCEYVSDRLEMGPILRPLCDILMGITPVAAIPVADTAANAESCVALMFEDRLIILCQQPRPE